jgi:predicted glycoside hydrolase/deacetylase ChbG (UPF0249 family)
MAMGIICGFFMFVIPAKLSHSHLITKSSFSEMKEQFDSCPNNEKEQCLGVRLGYAKNEKLLIITADDFGMCDSVNRATMKAFTVGFITSCALMPVGHKFNEAAAFCRACPEIDVGVHVALISEFGNLRYKPILSSPKANTLIDSNGYFWKDIKLFKANATIDAVREEIIAQIECVMEKGIRPSHLSMHMFILRCLGANPEEFMSMIMEISEKYNLPFRIQYNGLSKKYRDGGFAILDHLIWDSYYIIDSEKRRYYNQVIKDLQPGVNELIVHIGYADNELRKITPWQGRYQADFNIFTDKGMRNRIGKLKIKLINWSVLKDFQEKSLFETR